LTIAAEGEKADIIKPLRGLGSGVFEIALRRRGEACRVVCAVQLAEEVWVLHAFQKKSKHGAKTPRHENRAHHAEAEETKRDAGMKSERLELVRGSGNVFRDPGHKDADLEQFKALLAAEIIRELNREGLSGRRARTRTGLAAVPLARIRNANPAHCTVNELLSALNRLGARVDVSIRVRHPWRLHEGAVA